MSILRTLYPEKYRNSKKVEIVEVNYYEKHRPYAMYHGDTMEVTLNNGKTIYQISIEDDYSRGYVSLIVSEHKHTYNVILALLEAFREHGIPKLFHHDNGLEYSNGTVRRLLEMLGVSDISTKVENPKGNGKKERAHRQDRDYWYRKHEFQTLQEVEASIPDYLHFRNEVKGQWARYGKTAFEALQEGVAQKLTDAELERVIRDLYFEKGDRVVKADGKVRYKGRKYHLSKCLRGVVLEMRLTLKGIEAWFCGFSIKRWKYWGFCPVIAVGYTS